MDDGDGQKDSQCGVGGSEGASVQANFDSAPPFQPCVRKPQAANVRDPTWVKKGCGQAARSEDPGIAFGRRAAAAVRGAEIRGSLFFLPLRTREKKKKLPTPPTLNRPPTLLKLKPRRAAAASLFISNNHQLHFSPFRHQL